MVLTVADRSLTIDWQPGSRRRVEVVGDTLSLSGPLDTLPRRVETWLKRTALDQLADDTAYYADKADGARCPSRTPSRGAGSRDGASRPVTRSIRSFSCCCGGVSGAPPSAGSPCACGSVSRGAWGSGLPSGSTIGAPAEPSSGWP
ncbi:hypothetical protein WR25_26610 [Diploscapter pachys]|uniref:Uncharacterized protein n=1 Tax=Diploscapter pachys TaxID=2018661 RepID=A0A2A2KDH2_9BILA|nr:hypothetical protein WR25_26610 [Diploscapter pachys]